MKRAVRFCMAFLPSRIRIPLLRVIFGAKIGRGAHIGIGTVLLVSEMELGSGVRIGRFSYIKCRRLKMGNRATIGSLVYVSVDTLMMDHRSTVGFRVDIAGSHDGNGKIQLGVYTWIFPYCFINVARPVKLGRNVGIGGGSYLFTHGFWLSKLDGFPVAYGEVSIDDDTWLPWGCFIMPGVKIGKRVIVGARSVVNKSVPDGALVAGAPARIVREQSHQDLSGEEKGQIFEQLVSDYAESLGESLSIVRLDASTDFSIGGQVLISVRSEGWSPSPDPTVLNIYWEAQSPDVFKKAPCWSLADYSSSPESLLTPQMRSFLQFSRTIGLRFYPIDEQDGFSSAFGSD